MSIKIIDYDLVNENSNYDDLIALIKKLGLYLQVAKSSWVVYNNLSCVDIRDKLKTVVDDNDRLFVAELNGNAAWSNPIDGSSRLKKMFEKDK